MGGGRGVLIPLVNIVLSAPEKFGGKAQWPMRKRASVYMWADYRGRDRPVSKSVETRSNFRSSSPNPAPHPTLVTQKPGTWLRISGNCLGMCGGRVGGWKLREIFWLSSQMSVQGKFAIVGRLVTEGHCFMWFCSRLVVEKCQASQQLGLVLSSTQVCQASGMTWPWWAGCFLTLNVFY